MNKPFSLSLACLLLLNILFFSTCQKEYSYEGGAGTAVFTLNGAGGSCSGSILSGDYYVGTPLGSGNTVELLVNVDSVGTYSLSTNTQNGIHFSGSGIFLNTGEQIITLTGNGTPLTVGDFIFTASRGLGCSLLVQVSIAPADMADYTLSGAPNDCVNPFINGEYVAGVALTNANTIVLNVNVTSTGAYDFTTDTIDGISFSKSGTFTSTGDQTITLVGSGTPEFPRNLSFTPLSGNSKCTFKIAIRNPQPLATYVLESGFGNPNPCIYTLAGNYIHNTALVSSNTVSIRVYVSVVGNYTIATDTNNGMIFSYTGSFTSTGVQNVLLTGSGTPISPGLYTFIPEIVGPHPLGGQSCAFDVTVN